MNTDEVKAQRTPGNWEAHGCTVYQSDNWKDGINHGGKFICGIDSFEGPLPTEERRLNARLIAASPELLQALMELTKDAEMHLEQSGYEHDKAMMTLALIDQANRAITKAT